MACKFELTKKSEMYYPSHDHRELEVSVYGDMDMPDGKTTFVKMYIYREEPGDLAEGDDAMERLEGFLTSKEFYRRLKMALQPIQQTKPLQDT